MSCLNRLNLGCGFDKRDGWINADNFVECEPDLLFDIEKIPWPLEDSSFDYILMRHVLEHVGATFSSFKEIMRELYRILRPEGKLEIHVPHFRHDTWWSDPTHVRAFTPLTFRMMSRRQNDEWIEKKANYSMLSYLLDVNFETESAIHVYDAAWWQKVNNGELTKDELRRSSETHWGVIKELQVILVAQK